MINNELDITSKKDSLTTVFREIQHSSNLNLLNNNYVKFYLFDIDSNEFSYEGLYSCLKRNIGAYVYSRAKIQQFKEEDMTEVIAMEATDYLRKITSEKDKGAGGELGEILLYLFLEQILNAPKLLSKVEMKTAFNQYVYGSDGIHLNTLVTEEKLNYQIVLGEAKIIGSLKSAVDDAFESINKIKLDNTADLRLIESNIFKESFDDKTVEFIKSLLIPRKRNLSIQVDKAYGIFLGYTPSLNKNLSNSDFRKNVEKVVQDDIIEIVPYIENKIKKYGLEHNSIYIYIAPFNCAKDDRKNIIKKLKGES